MLGVVGPLHWLEVCLEVSKWWGTTLTMQTKQPKNGKFSLSLALSFSLSLSLSNILCYKCTTNFKKKTWVSNLTFCAAIAGRLGHCTNARQTMNRSCPSSQMSSSQMVSAFCQIINIVNSGIKCCSLWSKILFSKKYFGYNFSLGLGISCYYFIFIAVLT